MAGNLLTSYNATNFVLLDDYKMKFNSLDVGQPEVAVLLSGDSATVSCVTWKRGVMEESIRFKYIGMDYDSAQECAQAMRTDFTYTKYPWLFGDYISAGNWLYGWHKGVGTPTLESNITVQKRGSGCMYDVVVDGHTTLDNYTIGGYAALTNSRHIGDLLNSLPGYTSTHTLSGHHFDSAGADNITIVNAPTQTTQFELVAEDIYTTKKETSISSYTLEKNNWYRVTTDQYAQVKYEGMTKTACKNLYNSLATFGSSGWYLSSHPWELSAWFTSNSTQLNIEWVENTEVTTWQCLNDFKATEDDSGMFTAEITLHAQRVTMTDSPTSFTPPSWPSIWNNIPGFSDYL